MQLRSAFGALLLVTASACVAGKSPVHLPRLQDEGEVHVFLLPLPHEADQLSFTVETLSVRRLDGPGASLNLLYQKVVGPEGRGQRRLAWARVPPGEYGGLEMTVGAATLLRDAEQSRLLVPSQPVRIDMEFAVPARGAKVIWLALKTPHAIQGDVEFSPSFTATVAPQTPPQAALYCTNTGAANLTAVDLHARLVTGIIPVGEAPRGIALDPSSSRAYVALATEDQVEVVDVAANVSVGGIRLAPGDGPGEVALAPDGILVVVNERSRTVSFVDPVALVELGRVPVGDDPSALLLDRSGRRAYVANRGAATITVIDVPNRAVAATLATDSEPLQMQLSRDGSRLYVVHRGSGYLSVFAVPSFAAMTRAYVALGATTIRVDPRSDLIYLSRGDEQQISVYDPLAFQLLDQFYVPGAVSYMTIDDSENALLALMPQRRTIAVIDLTSRKLLAEIPVGEDPYRVAALGVRF